MGCDIHFVVEYNDPYREEFTPVYFSDDRWNDHWPGFPDIARPPTGCAFWDLFANRNYNFFGELAEVRTYPAHGPFGTQGVPKNASSIALNYEHDSDSHSHGHCSLQAFFDAHAHATQSEGLVASRKLQNKPLSIHQDGFDLQYIDQYRVVFWFDN